MIPNILTVMGSSLRARARVCVCVGGEGGAVVKATPLRILARGQHGTVCSTDSSCEMNL